MQGSPSCQTPGRSGSGCNQQHTHEGSLSSLPSFLSWPLPRLMQCKTCPTLNRENRPNPSATEDPKTSYIILYSICLCRLFYSPPLSTSLHNGVRLLLPGDVCAFSKASFVDQDFPQSNPLVCHVRRCPTLVLNSVIGCGHGDNLPVSLTYYVSRSSRMPFFCK